MKWFSFISLLIAGFISPFGSSHASTPTCDSAANVDTLKKVIRTQKVVQKKNKLYLPYKEDSAFPHFTMEERSFGSYHTTVYRPTRIQPENANVIVPLLHGLNADVSQGGSMLFMAKELTKLNKAENGAKAIYTEALDLPGCGHNTDVHPLNTFESTIDFYTQYLKELKAKAPGKPMVPVGFCYSAGFLMEVAKRNPGLIDGLILNALIPTETAIFKDAYLVESQLYQEGKYIMNPAVRDLADKAYTHLDISTGPHLLGKTPILLLVGEKDPFLTEDAYRWFKHMADNNPDHIQYMLVPNGGHGVLAPVKEHPENFGMVSNAVQALIDTVKQTHKP